MSPTVTQRPGCGVPISTQREHSRVRPSYAAALGLVVLLQGVVTFGNCLPDAAVVRRAEENRDGRAVPVHLTQYKHNGSRGKSLCLAPAPQVPIVPSSPMERGSSLGPLFRGTTNKPKPDGFPNPFQNSMRMHG